jgi:hypothetical protein
VVNSDKSLVRGASTGSVVIFDAATHRPLCQSPVKSVGSSEVTTSVRVRVRPNGEHVQLDSPQAALHDAARADLMFQFHYAVGDALGQIAPGVQRAIGFFH